MLLDAHGYLQCFLHLEDLYDYLDLAVPSIFVLSMHSLSFMHLTWCSSSCVLEGWTAWWGENSSNRKGCQCCWPLLFEKWNSGDQVMQWSSIFPVSVPLIVMDGPWTSLDACLRRYFSHLWTYYPHGLLSFIINWPMCTNLFILILVKVFRRMWICSEFPVWKSVWLRYAEFNRVISWIFGWSGQPPIILVFLPLPVNRNCGASPFDACHLFWVWNAV